MLRYFKSLFVRFLKQGLSPEKLALCVALGTVIGVFPVLGSTTLLCAGVALAAGLNQPAIQSVNYIVYPLQLLLLIPMYRLGAWLFQAPPLPISGEGVRHLIQSGVVSAIRILWTTTWHAMIAWSLIAPAVTWAIYLIVTPIFRLLNRLNG